METIDIPPSTQRQQLLVEYVSSFWPVGAWVCIKETHEAFQLLCTRCKKLLCDEKQTTELCASTEDGLCFCSDCFTLEEIEQLSD